MALKDVLIVMEQIGFTQVILPFIIVFTVVFAVLQRSNVLGVTAKGKPKANLNAMVAFVLAFFVLIMVRTLNVITWFTRFTVLLLVAFVFLGIIFSFLGVQEHHKSTLMFVGLMLLGFVLLEALAFAGVIDADVMNRLLLPVIAVVFLVGTVYFVTRKPAKEKPAESAAAAAPPAAPARQRTPPPAEMQAPLTEEELGEAIQEVIKKRRRNNPA